MRIQIRTFELFSLDRQNFRFYEFYVEIADSSVQQFKTRILELFEPIANESKFSDNTCDFNGTQI